MEPNYCCLRCGGPGAPSKYAFCGPCAITSVSEDAGLYESSPVCVPFEVTPTGDTGRLDDNEEDDVALIDCGTAGKCSRCLCCLRCYDHAVCVPPEQREPRDLVHEVLNGYRPSSSDN